MILKSISYVIPAGFLKCISFVAAAIIFSLLWSKPGFASPAAQSPSSQSEWGISLQHFKWTETGETGNRLVKETGILYALRQEYARRKNYFGWRQGAGLFFGNVDYDGYTWTKIPIKTDVTYVGANAFFDLEPTYQWPSGFLVKGFAGLGGRLWLRDLKSTRTAAGTRVAGAEEWWWSIYGRVGAGMGYSFRRFGRIFAEYGLKLPIYTRNHATFFVAGSPTVDLEPEQTVSPFIHLGWHWKKIRLGVFYDTLRFADSDRVKSKTSEFYQPESDAEIAGVELSTVFTF